VLDIDFSNTTIINDEFSGHIDVILQNSGCDTAENFQVSLETEGSLTFTPQTISSLLPDSSTTVVFNVSGPWFDCGGPGCEFTATADPDEVLCECSGANNIRIEPFAGPTNIVLSSFDATVADNKVTLKWTSETEPNNAGFNVYRSKQESANYNKINSTIIPAQGTTTSGANYTYTDELGGSGTYYYKLQDIDLQGRESYHGPVSVVITSVEIDKSSIPDKYSLSQNYPNPFNPETKIEFGLPKPGLVTINIYDINGHLVSKLMAERKSAGYHSVIWDGRNRSGITVSTGMYFYHFKAGDFGKNKAGLSQTRKMILIK